MRADYITIDGKKVRVEVNWNALTAFLEATDRNTMDGLSDLELMKPTDIAPLMAACVNEGERLDGREASYTGLQIGELCGIGEMTQFIRIYTSQMAPKLPAEKKDVPPHPRVDHSPSGI